MINLVEYTNGLSAQWVGGMWNAVWQSTVLAVAILLLILCLKRAPSSLRFWLWMLVPLRLLVMPILTVDLALLPPDMPETAATATIAAMEPQGAGVAMPLEIVPDDHFAGGYAELEMTPIAATAAGPVDISPKNDPPSLWAYLMAAWACGAIFIAIRMGIGYWTTRRIVARATQVKDGHVLDLARQAARMLGLRHPPQVLLTEAKVSPFVLGAWRPVVVLPYTFVETVNHGQLLAVLAHEAAHLRRNDFIVGWVIAACEVLYFFHPVVHFVNRRLLLEREKACDDWVLVASRAKPSHYAQAILTAAGSACAVQTRLQPKAVVAESFTVLSQRLSSIASTVKPKAGLSARACVFLCVLGALCIPGIALTAKKAESIESAESVESTAPGSFTLAIDREPSQPEEKTLDDLPSTTNPTIEPLAQADVDNDKFRVLHFPEDSGLGVLSVLTHRGTKTYRLGREAGPLHDWDKWEELSSARGDVTVPIGKPLKLTIYTGGLQYLDHLSNLAPNDLYMISFQPGTSTSNRPIVYGEQVLPYVQHLTGLKVLQMYGVENTGKGLRFIKDLRDLERLELGSDSYFEDMSLANLQNLTSLEVLNLYVPVSDRGLQYLSALTSLRELTLKYQNIRGPGLAYLADIPSLEFLQIRGDGFGNQTGGPTNSALQYLEGVTSLKSLMLYTTTNITDAAMRHLTKLTNLEELKFIRQGGTIRITDAGMPALGTMTQLRSLDIGVTLVTDRGLAYLRGLTNLEKLRLPNSRRTRAGTPTITDAALAHVSQLPRLKRINALNGAFTDEGLRSLAGLRRLEELYIHSNSDAGKTDAGLEYIADLSRLKELSISWGGATNQGMAHLAKLRSLRFLSLGSAMPRVTVSGVNALNSLTELRELRIGRIARDNEDLDLGALTNLEILSVSIRSPNANDREGAVRDKDLVSIGNLNRLTNLSVGYSPSLTDEGLAPIAKLKRLERLAVGGENLTDRGLAHLAGLTSLWQLTITGDFSDEGLRQLDGLKGIRYLTIRSKRGLSPQTEQRIRRNLPNLYSLNGRRLGAGK